MLSYSRDSPHFVEPEAALPFSQNPATGSYPEHKNPIKLLPHSFFDMSLNFSFMAIASKWHFSSGFLRETLFTSILSLMCGTKHVLFVAFDLITLIKFD